MAAEVVKKKLLLLGDAAVGKTSLVQRYVVDQFDDRYITTIGTKVTKKEILIDDEERGQIQVILTIWDVLGQKGFSGVQSLSAERSSGLILVADFTRPETLQSLNEYWIPMAEKVTSKIPKVFLANKDDLGYRQFSMDDMAREASFHNAPCFATSAKSGANVEEAFEALVLQLPL